MVNARAQLLAVVLLAAACSNDGSAVPPDGFGVNVVIDARGVASATRARIARGVLTAQGPGATPVVKPMAIDSAAIGSGELRFRYIPASTSGMVSFVFDALDTAGAVVASGRTTSALTLVAGKAVTAQIVLASGGSDGGTDGPTSDGGTDKPGRKANGDPCQAGNECTSDFCVEGVCCNSACNGVCESCIAGQRGRCDPAPDGTDPKMQCGPALVPDAGVPTDGGGDDGGPGDGGIQAPDGGLQGSNQQCAGTCNGMRACRFPGSEKPCGNRWCNTDDQVGAMVCDGQGACGPQLTACTDYACADGSCRTRCAAHEECQPAKTWCNASSQCVPKKADGLGCVTGDECRSGHCAGPPGAAVCCNSACDAPFTCTETPGKCKCPGVSCAAGVPCQVFYRDSDGDGAGDKFGTLAPGGNGNAQAACADAPPAGFVSNNTDCDDGDANAKPGQTGFFDVPSRTKGTYDYDCDGNIVKGITENLGSECVFCTGGETLFSCGKPRTTCVNAGDTAGQSCSIHCTDGGRGGFFFCFCGPNDGFITAVNCGVTGRYKVCGTCNAAGQAPAYPYDYDRKQTCH
jgi:hypothetical protein